MISVHSLAQELARLPNDAGLPWEMQDIWLQWLDLAYVKNGQGPPARAPVERPAQRRRVAPVEVSETLG